MTSTTIHQPFTAPPDMPNAVCHQTQSEFSVRWDNIQSQCKDTKRRKFAPVILAWLEKFQPKPRNLHDAVSRKLISVEILIMSMTSKMEEDIAAICWHPELCDTTSYLQRDWTKKEIARRKVIKEVGLPGKFWKYVSVTWFELLVVFFDPDRI